MRKLKVIHTKVGEIALLDNGILRVAGNSNVHIELADMMENDVAFRELLQGSRAPFLVLFGENVTISVEAREYFSESQRSQIKTAEALVVPQLHHKMLARNHTHSRKPQHPTMTFDSEEDALAWLQQFVG